MEAFREILILTNLRLDRFARERGYTDIFMMHKYKDWPQDIAGITLTDFEKELIRVRKVECTYLLDVLSQTYNKLNEIIQRIISGEILPITYQELEPMLPPLVWPIEKLSVPVATTT